jgi:hypothetical protein
MLTDSVANTSLRRSGGSRDQLCLKVHRRPVNSGPLFQVKQPVIFQLRIKPQLLLNPALG